MRRAKPIVRTSGRECALGGADVLAAGRCERAGRQRCARAGSRPAPRAGGRRTSHSSAAGIESTGSHVCRVGRALLPALAEVAVEQLAHRRRRPRSARAPRWSRVRSAPPPRAGLATSRATSPRATSPCRRDTPLAAAAHPKRELGHAERLAQRRPDRVRARASTIASRAARRSTSGAGASRAPGRPGRCRCRRARGCGW